MQSSVCHCIVTAPDHVFLSFSPPSIMELREIEKWDVIEEYFKDFSYFFSLVSRRFFLFPKFVIFVRFGSVINSITNLSRERHIGGGADRFWKLSETRIFHTDIVRMKGILENRAEWLIRLVYQSFEIFYRRARLWNWNIVRHFRYSFIIRDIEKEFYYAMVKQRGTRNVYEWFREINAEWQLIDCAPRFPVWTRHNEPSINPDPRFFQETASTIISTYCIPRGNCTVSNPRLHSLKNWGEQNFIADRLDIVGWKSRRDKTFPSRWSHARYAPRSRVALRPFFSSKFFPRNSPLSNLELI